MGAQGNASLQTEILNGITTVTQTEGITPANLGSILSDLAASAQNITDDITAIATGMSVSALAAAIVAQTLIPGQWIYINNRSDANPLYVQALTTMNISPLGIQTKSGNTYLVIMDYINGNEGITKPFIASFDSNYKFWLQQISGNSNGSLSAILKASGSCTFGTVNAGNTYDQTITVTGAAVGDPVILGIPETAMSGTNMSSSTAFSYIAFVSATNTVTVRFINASASNLTPNTANFNVTIMK